MTQTLKPCPFCESPRVRLTEKRKGNYRREGSYFQGLCGACFARGPLLQTKEEAVEAWNARAAGDRCGKCKPILRSDPNGLRVERLPSGEPILV